MAEKYDKYALFRRGADDGFLFGAYLVVLFLSMAYSMQLPPLGLLSMIMMLGVPVYTYMRLNHAYKAEHYTCNFSSLWMQGIVMFFCGSLIMALATFVFMTWIQPDFIIDQMEAVIATYKDIDWNRGREMADVLQHALDAKIIPSPIQVAMEMLWSGVFTGSLLSILISLLVQARKP